jgi:hypothetical protein
MERFHRFLLGPNYGQSEFRAGSGPLTAFLPQL